MFATSAFVLIIVYLQIDSRYGILLLANHLMHPRHPLDGYGVGMHHMFSAICFTFNWRAGITPDATLHWVRTDMTRCRLKRVKGDHDCLYGVQWAN